MPARRRAAAVLVLALLCTACTGGTDPREPAAGPAPSAEDGAGTSAAGVESVDPADVVARQVVALPESPQDEVELAVLPLRREGRVVQLRLLVTPRFSTSSETDAVSLFRALGGTTFAPTLVDVQNLKEYAVLQGEGAGQVWRSDDLQTQAQNGRALLAYAWFAAPEDAVDGLDVRVTDFWPAFTGVPVAG